MNLIAKLNKLGLSLPKTTQPGGNYQSVNIRDNIAYVSVQFPIVAERYLYQGRLGDNLTTDDGYKAMQYCALNVLSQIEAKIGFDNVLGLNHIEAYYQSTENWDDAPEVVNGASNLFQTILKEKGTHSRTIFGVDKLPRNFAVGLTCSFTLSRDYCN